MLSLLFLFQLSFLIAIVVAATVSSVVVVVIVVFVVVVVVSQLVQWPVFVGRLGRGASASPSWLFGLCGISSRNPVPSGSLTKVHNSHSSVHIKEYLSDHQRNYFSNLLCSLSSFIA